MYTKRFVPSHQVDVYSFGLLLCEMCTRELPDPERRGNQIRRVSGALGDLVRRCVRRDPNERPKMNEVVAELEQLPYNRRL